ncbi:MAG: papain-like cysteine protease family protein [Polyangiales bacterium]
MAARAIRISAGMLRNLSFARAATFAALALGATGCCRPELVGSVANTLKPQETNNWCWAATTEMLANHFDLSASQCGLANHRFGKSNCCEAQTRGSSCPKTNDCNTPGWLELTHVGLSFSESGTARTWEAMRSEIYCGKRPMGYAYGTQGVVGHVLVVKGYVTVGSTRYLVLNDPWSPCSGTERLITYEEYADPAGTATHWNTWYQLAKQ